MNDTKFITQKVESQLSYSVYAKVQKESIVQRKEAGSRRNPENTVRLEKDKNSGRGGVPGLCAYADRNTGESSSGEFHGILQGKEQCDDLREKPGIEV